MSNFGQSSLGNTKVGACREHEDSGRGEYFMPGLIRGDRNNKGAFPSEGEGEEGGEGGVKQEIEGMKQPVKVRPRMLLSFNTYMSVFVNVTLRACSIYST